MRLTEEQHKKRGMPILKFHQYFGTDQINNVINKNYDYYTDGHTTHVYEKKQVN